jgi:sodium-dependent dicarboxylate transporter 2/3/5
MRENNLLQVFIALLIGLFCYNIPLSLTLNEIKLVAILSGVFYLWIFSHIPLAITGLMGVLLTSILEIQNLKSAFAPYGNPIIILFMGSFFLARALEVHHVDKILAYRLTLLPIIAANSKRLIVAIIIMCTGFSFWLSNTATTAIFLPITLGIINSIHGLSDKARASIVLSIAYAATLGGNGSPVGSPPNIIAVEFLQKNLNISISFFDWFIKALPVVIISTSALIFLTLRDLKDIPEKIDLEHIKKELHLLGHFNSSQKFLLTLLMTTIFLWLLPGLIGAMAPQSSFYIFTEKILNETHSILIMSSLLFIIPIDKKPLLTWEKAQHIDWGTLLLFGSGLSLGNAIFDTGLATNLSQIFHYFSDVPSFLIISIIIVFTVIFTEAVSNTAAANMLIPVYLVIAQSMNLDPVSVILPATLACNIGFMMPVGTPPNAMAYGTGMVKISMMMKRGLVMNIICSLILMIWAYFI